MSDLDLTTEGTTTMRLNAPMALSWLRMGYPVVIQSPYLRCPVHAKMYATSHGFGFHVKEDRARSPLYAEFSERGIAQVLRGERGVFESDLAAVAA